MNKNTTQSKRNFLIGHFSFFNYRKIFVFGLFIFSFLFHHTGYCQWTSKNSGVSTSLWGIYFPSSTVGYAVGVSGVILKTSDGGENWTIQNSGSTEYLACVYFFDEMTGLVGGYNGTMLKTTDGGTNWSVISLSGITNKIYNMSFVDNQTGFFCGENGALYKTTDGGDSWSVFPSVPPVNTSIEDILFVDNNVGYFTGDGVGSNVMYKTTDGGNNWSAQSLPFGNTNNQYSIVALNKDTVFVVGGDKRIVRTFDGGQNWIDKSSTLANYYKRVNFSPDGILYAIGWDGTKDSGVIISSNNLGNTFTPYYYGESIDLYDIFFTPCGDGFVVGDGGIILKKSLSSFIITQPSNQSIIEGNNTSFSVSSVLGNATYQWQENTGSGFTDLADNSTYSGSTISTLTISSAPLSLNNAKYHCIVTIAGVCIENSNDATLTVSPVGIIENLVNSGNFMSVISNSNNNSFQIVINADALRGKIIIQNVLGQNLLSYPVNNQTSNITVSTENFIPGVYNVAFNDGKNQFTKRVLVK